MTEQVGVQLDDDSLLALFSRVRALLKRPRTTNCFGVLNVL